ncbi:MAG: inositol monophosphatase [Limnochordaceae bacterium]|nr:inositol monophosphatase [Limnochordaceae bacterium]
METARMAAERAGRLLREHWQEFLAAGIGFKGPVDLVTEGDRRSEAAIVEIIRSRHPDHDLLTEERGALGEGADHRWLVDPLDGTTNYAHGFPVFAVSVAVEYRGQLQAAAVYEPVSERSYVAGRGRGAWRNGRRLTVSTVEELDRSLLATGFAYDLREAEEETNLDHFDHFSRAAQGIRRLGAAAMDLCWVAEGWLDGFWEYRLHPWDVAAGILLVEEAGGRVTGFRGEALDLRQLRLVNIVASNGRIHDAMLRVLEQGRTGMRGTPGSR